MNAKSLSIILLLSTCKMTFSQLIEPDKINDISIQPITHGTVVLEWKDTTIYVDPYGGAQKFKNLKDPDIIVITHAHGDHLNIETLYRLVQYRLYQLYCGTCLKTLKRVHIFGVS